MNKRKLTQRCRRAGVLCAATVLCLIAAGCAREKIGSPTTAGDGANASVETTDLDFETIPTAPAADLHSTAPQETASGLLIPGTVKPGQPLKLDGTNKLRIRYTENVSSVIYITSADQLPDYEELKEYDDAYFENHALVLVTETVSSGSVRVDIAGIQRSGGDAFVVLSRQGFASGVIGTSDMATWLLWAEVEAGLDCRWTVQNPELPGSAK